MVEATGESALFSPIAIGGVQVRNRTVLPSMTTRLADEEGFVTDAALAYRGDAQTPIAAELVLASPAASGPLSCSLDWRRTEGELWTISIESTDGLKLDLLDGGSRLEIDGLAQEAKGIGEYPDIYRRFAELIARRESEIDLAPLRMVADALLVGRRESA